MDQPGLFDPNSKPGEPETDLTLPSPVELVPAPADATPRKVGRMPKRIVLVDGHALAFRSYFAIQALSTKSGRPVQAIFGFLRTILKLLRDGGSRRKVSADHAIIVVFDAPAKTFRHEEFDSYKAGRAPTPEDLPQQIREIKHLVDLLGLSRLELAGFEADDIIGTLARRAEIEGIEVRILSPDRDAFQLLSDRVKVLTSDYEEFGPEDVQKKYGVSVAQWVDYRSLTGDASDNIPGAKGIGPKTAQKLLQDYGTLDFILGSLDEVKPEKVSTKIRESYQAVLDSKRLSQIVTDVPVDLDFRAALVRDPDEPALVRELRSLEFASFVRELGLENKREVTALGWTAPPQAAVFGFTLSEDSAALANLTGLAFAGEDGEVHAHPDPTDAALDGLGEVNGADAKALAVFGRTHGHESLEPGDDPILMAYVLDSNAADPANVSQRYLEEDWPREPAGRAAAAQSLLKTLSPLLTGRLRSVYEDIERPVSKVLAAMETRGVSLDVPYLRGLSETMTARMAELEQNVWDLAGERFNLNSRDRLEAILYDKLQLESGKKTKLTGKRSTAVSALEPLRDAHPIVAKLLDYRELSKLKGTYLDPLPTLINPATGRLHTTFSQTVAATGRLSSLNPNLQNIPVRTETGREIRKGFIAAPGFLFMSADYSQIELRILAEMTGEPGLMESFLSKEDIHRRTAATILGLTLEQVTPDQRRGAKAINYGVLYGMSARRLSQDWGVSYQEAAEFIERYFKAYPLVAKYIEDTKAFCRANGYVEDLFGRRRYLPEINNRAFNVREAAERAAVNMPIQGSNADIIKLAMIRLEPELCRLGARLLLQVHDELIVEAPEDHVEAVQNLVCDLMSHTYELSVPIEVGVGYGRSWYDAK